MDGASNSMGSGQGCYALQFKFSASNNMAKYEALINDMQTVIEIGVSYL